jgi:hypothetical protein
VPDERVTDHALGRLLQELVMATRSSSKSGGRGSGKRELITPNGDARYIRRDAQGRIRESDDVGRAQQADRRRKAKTKVKSGYGDRGDR